MTTTAVVGAAVTHWDQWQNTNIVPRLDSGALSMGMATTNLTMMHTDR
jgi:hypothetical protein